MDDLPKPNMGRVFMKPLMPKKMHIDHGGLHGGGDIANVTMSNKEISEIFGDGCDQIRGLNDGQQAHEVREFYDNTPFDALAL